MSNMILKMFDRSIIYQGSCSPIDMCDDVQIIKLNCMSTLCSAFSNMTKNNNYVVGLMQKYIINNTSNDILDELAMVDQVVDIMQNAFSNIKSDKLKDGPNAIIDAVRSLNHSFNQDYDSVFGLDLHIIANCASYYVLEDDYNVNIDQEKGFNFLLDLSSDDLILLAKNHSFETFLLVSLNYMKRKLSSFINKSFNNTRIKSLIEYNQSRIKQHELYNKVKQSKYYITSPSQGKRLLNDFVKHDNDGLYDFIKEIIKSKIKFDDVNLSNIKSEILVGSVFFILEDLYENIDDIISSYIYYSWVKAIQEEYSRLNKFNNNTGETKLIVKDIVEVVSETNLDSDDTIEKYNFSDEQSQFIASISDYISNIDSALSNDICSYLQRVIKNNRTLRIKDWLITKNIILDNNSINGLNKILMEYGFVDDSVSNVHVSKNTVVGESEQKNIITIDEKQNNINQRIDTLEDAKKYLYQLYPKMDVESFDRQYNNLLLHLQSSFLSQLEKTILNSLLLKNKYNYRGNQPYKRLAFALHYRFAIEIKTGRVYLGNHEDYDYWLTK